jgi:Family of unknown function (DUF5670)
MYCPLGAAWPAPIIGRLQRFNREATYIMLFVIAAILIVLWGLGFIAFRVASSFIHLLLVIGVILLALHFLRR